MAKTFTGADGKSRCSWCAATPEYMAYHDQEWGFPVADDRRLFEKLCLEGFQSGLSWRTILAKRENFRAAFHGFDFERIARYTDRDVRRLLADAGIVRHRGKIEAVINNAKRAQEMIRSDGSLAAYFWGFEQQPDPRLRISRDLKKLGWKFVGPTTVHSFLQAMGLVNEHVEDCVIRRKVERERKAFRRPTR